MSVASDSGAFMPQSPVQVSARHAWMLTRPGPGRHRHKRFVQSIAIVGPDGIRYCPGDFPNKVSASELLEVLRRRVAGAPLSAGLDWEPLPPGMGPASQFLEDVIASTGQSVVLEPLTLYA